MNCGQNIGQISNSIFSPDDLRKEKMRRLPLSQAVRTYLAFDQSTIIFRNAKIWDGKGNPVKENSVVVIRDGFISAIDSIIDPYRTDNAKIIDAKGKTLIPGIVGLHNHLHMPGIAFMGITASKLYLAAGVTTIQTCGSIDTQKEIELAVDISKGLIAGPDIFTSGPYFTGEGGNPNMIIPRDASHIRDTMRHWINLGVRWFKVYRHTKPEDLAMIIGEAHRAAAKVTGHFCSVTFEEATRLGIDGIEHGLNSVSDFRENKPVGICGGSRDYMDHLDISGEEVKRLQRLMIDSNVFMTSTLSIYESSIPARATADQRTLEAMNPRLLSEYHDRNKASEDSSDENKIRELRLKKIMEFDHQFFNLGGLLTAGVDPGRHNLPGYGDQRNFELLREAGFKTEEAIKVMTYHGAKALAREDIGSIEVGKRANLVLLNGDLATDPSVIRNVQYIFKDGYAYDPKELIEEVKGKVGNE